MNESNIIPAFTSLPNWVTFEKCVFRLILFNDGNEEVRLCYELETVEILSPHFELWKKSRNWFHPKTKTYCNFLLLYENIEDDAELLEAIKHFKKILKKYKIIND